MISSISTHKLYPARSLTVTTAHGTFQTPTFMPVATYAIVNNIMSHDLTTCGSQIILGGNTYHMLNKPGMDIIREGGGMHKFMNWHGPMLTDSGGFQVFSLSKNSKICKIDENGARFKDPNTGQLITMNAEISINTQKTIGADIIMAFDQCTPDNADYKTCEQILDRTHRWLEISKNTHLKNPNSEYGYKQYLFGIIQGGIYQDLREKSTEFILSQDLDGIAIGGESIGFNMEKTREIINWVRPMLPENKVRYTMGVGLNPQDLLDVIKEGIDIFDCVAPTRNARHGALYCGKIIIENDWPKFIKQEDEDRDRILIKKSVYKHDQRPIMDDCDCYTCQNHTRSYLHYLFKNLPHLYMSLACIHNIRVMHLVCDAARNSVIISKN